MVDWQKFKYKVIQIDLSKKKRESKWIASCSNCQCEREISYCQAWNIASEKDPNHCGSCKTISAGKVYFEKGQSPWNKGINYKPDRSYDKNRMQMEIVHTFGIIVSIETKEKQRQAKLGKFGELANAWEGGKTKERILLMSRDDYKQLRKDCLRRDNFTCQICKVSGGKLEMDHIKEWCNYPELRYELSNVRTLCKDCHKTTDNFCHKARKKAS